ncbi:MAG: monofunctional biosynthetic peptidoglycan transglycosylase [Caulobacteraceae bacterium]|nr:monofunctional biosynthetic peptidoglycan transglycosylase [Caulobacteraceae bacterium]
MSRKPQSGRKPAKAARPKRRSRFWRGLLLFVAIFGVVGPVTVTLVYRFVPPPITWLMVQRMVEGRGFERDWVPLERISPQLVRSVIAAEDARFCEHHGFDILAIRKAMAANKRGGKVRGGSTISQQTAKNIFLWPRRDYVRKGLEAYFTVLIETLWGKERIMEVYLNSIEWGPGVYGAEAAARRNFGVHASQLSAAQAARLAAIVPKPLSWKAARPGPYVKRRSGKIDRAAGTVRRDGLARCVL